MITKPTDEARAAIRKALDAAALSIFADHAEALGSCDESEMLAVCFGICAVEDDFEIAQATARHF
jgi:hypothetical protein